jgi:hypothetical protein
VAVGLVCERRGRLAVAERHDVRKEVPEDFFAEAVEQGADVQDALLYLRAVRLARGQEVVRREAEHGEPRRELRLPSVLEPVLHHGLGDALERFAQY